MNTYAALLLSLVQTVRILWQVGFAVPLEMGFRAVNGKFDMTELVVFMVVTTKEQRSGCGTFSGGCF